MKPIDNKEEFIRILNRYDNGEANNEERLLVEKWYEVFDQENEILEKISYSDQLVIEKRMENVLRQHIANSRISGIRSIFGSIISIRNVAASVLILIIAGLVIYSYNQPIQSSLEQQNIVAHDLKPGGTKAILRLDDGSSIALENADLKMLAKQGYTQIHKLEEGLITYTNDGVDNSNQMNTIISPAGGEYSVKLSDGSQVWLNSESSITFPSTFATNERIVSITGEVYFDITKDSERPFYVEVGSVQKLKVLGTQFNVNAYKDEGMVTTTLIQGSVEILQHAKNKRGIRLKPGEQSTINEDGELLIREDVDTEEILAWKNGIFQFEDADLNTVMRQIGRWYNVEIQFSEEEIEGKFSGKINRNMNASEVFEILKFAGLNFKIETLPSSTKKGKVIVNP